MNEEKEYMLEKTIKYVLKRYYLSLDTLIEIFIFCIGNFLRRRQVGELKSFMFSKDEINCISGIIYAIQDNIRYLNNEKKQGEMS